MRVDSTSLVTAIQSVIGPEPRALHEPSLGELEVSLVQSCVESSYVSSYGPMTSQFEADLSLYTGAQSVLATSSGTAALHLSMLSCGVRPGDEVIVPSLTFVATTNAVAYCGATPHFVDVNENTMAIDAERLRSHLQRIASSARGVTVNTKTGRPLSAVVPMHTLGLMADMSGVLEVAEEFGLGVIEDAAEAMGTTSNGRHAGTFAQLGTLSFNGNKVMTTGGGGAVLGRDDDIADLVRHLATTAKRPHSWEFFHDQVGYNYRMPSLNAALGIAQLRRLEELVARKRALHDAYLTALSPLPGVSVMKEPSGTRSNYWLVAVRLHGITRDQRDEMLQDLLASEIGARPLWNLQHGLPMYAKSPRDHLPVSNLLENEIICLPSSASLRGPS